MKETLPERLDCTVTHAGIPVAGVMLSAEFSTRRKNPYVVVLGPTNQLGHTSIDRAEILSHAQNQLNLALMDYDPLESTFAGTISLKVMSIDDLRRALEAYDLFKRVAAYPLQYKDNIENAMQVVARTDFSTLSIIGKAVPSGVVVSS